MSNSKKSLGNAPDSTVQQHGDATVDEQGRLVCVVLSDGADGRTPANAKLATMSTSEWADDA